MGVIKRRCTIDGLTFQKQQYSLRRNLENPRKSLESFQKQQCAESRMVANQKSREVSDKLSFSLVKQNQEKLGFLLFLILTIRISMFLHFVVAECHVCLIFYV